MSHVNMLFDHMSTFKEHSSRVNQSGIFSSGVSNAMCHISLPANEKISLLLNSSTIQVGHDKDVVVKLQGDFKQLIPVQALIASLFLKLWS